MPERVQFREDPRVLAYVESRGFNPNDLARALFEAEVRRLQAEEKWEQLRSAGIRLDRPAAELVRADRDRR